MSTRKRLKVWSSACSTGEEPYSLIMLFKKMQIIDNVYLIASDLDKDALEKAKQGIYSQKELINVPKEFIKDNFTNTNHQYFINNDVKKLVDFQVIDLLEDKFPTECDLILCRNVMIYFTEEAKEKLYRKFFNALSDEGVFFVGSTEQIIMPQKYGFTSIKNFFYQKSL
jgi:chemotaxis protein methyltransferase CheR